MAFPRKLLNEGEECVLDLRPHWWYMAEPTAALLGAIVAGIVVLTSRPDEDPNAGWQLLTFLAIAVVVFALGWFVVRYLKWITTNFVVTTDRLIYRSGVVAKSGIEIPLERVNTVFFNQTMFERMLGAGDLAIESGGETGKQTFSDIRRPSVVQNEIYRQMEANENRKYDRIGAGHRSGPPPTQRPGGAELSILEQIEKLDELRQRGVISDQEFAAKKADLLNRM